MIVDIMDTDALVDEFMRQKDPAFYEMTEADKALLQEGLRKLIGGTSQEHIDRAIAAQRKMKIAYLGGFIKPGAPFTAEEILADNERRRAHRVAGRNIPAGARPAVKVAIDAFVEVDRKAGTHAEAMALAMEKTSVLKPQVDEKTVKRWLTAILPFSNIQPPRRGRPPKKQE
ncbi:MAG: hypothetical protein VX920_08100 [Pseudomonadota bacterium]|nr:hypothetical protein [Pseudomonadota bacterium]